MNITSIQIWGDSVLKGIFFDETRKRYAILRDNAARLVEQELEVPVINHSRMGCTAPEGLAELSGDSTPMNETLVLIEYGGNDCDMDWAAVAAAPEGEHFPKTPPALFEQALRSIVSLVRARGGIPVLSTLPPLDADRYFNWVSQGLSRENILKYIGGAAARIYRWQEYYSTMALRLSADMQCLCLPLREYFLEKLNGQDIHSLDGIHLNELGHRMMAEAALTAISKRLPNLRSATMAG